MISFAQRVLKAVSQIPKGQTLSYQEVALKAGSPRAFRAVGSILKKNWDPSIPCHRVICSNGQLGEYNRGKEKKRALLVEEGAIPL